MVHFPTHLRKLVLPDTKRKQRLRERKKKKTYRPMSFMNTDTKIHNKLLANVIQQYKRVVLKNIYIKHDD